LPWIFARKYQVSLNKINFLILGDRGFTYFTDSRNAMDGLRFNEQGLIPAVCQDKASGAVLMVAWMNAEALQCTLMRGEAYFWSRSREELWHKGATSGNYLKISEIWADCDGDTLLLSVIPVGPACHTGEQSCFFRQIG
jgi:phosphoribosyl-AMP cyclohydrolase